jgi:hypothetical protein
MHAVDGEPQYLFHMLLSTHRTSSCLPPIILLPWPFSRSTTSTTGGSSILK